MISEPSPRPMTITDGSDISATALSSPSRLRWFGGKRRWGVSIAIAALLGGAIIWRVSGPAASPLETLQPLPVVTRSADPVTGYTTERAYTGELVAQRSSALGFERAGTLVTLWVDDGDTVAAGQPLAQLDTRSLEAERQQLVAQRQEALAQLQELEAGPRQEAIATAAAAVAELEQQVALAQLQRDRREDLYTDGAISREELDQQTFNTGALEQRLGQAQSQLDELQAGTRPEQLAAQAARVARLEASLEKIDVDLEKSVLYAPFEGRVGTRRMDEGVVAQSGQTVLTLLETGPLEARVGVPPAVADQLAVGEAYPVQLRDRTVTAQITALLPELDSPTRTVTVVLTMPTTDMSVGQTVRLLVEETQAAAGFWLPSTALVPAERGLWSVYVLTDAGSTDATANPAALDATVSPEPRNAHTSTASPNTYQVGRRDVEVIHTAGDRVLVQGTLQAGERVISEGIHRVVPGTWVRWQP